MARVKSSVCTVSNNCDSNAPMEGVAMSSTQRSFAHETRPSAVISAIAAGADAYITGEVSEPQVHLARETGVAFLACGHHATERYGAPAVATHVAAHFGLEHRFIEIGNPA